MMPELYYFHDATCGIKARLALFEKGVQFTPRVLSRNQLSDPDYLAINPKGVVPTLVHDGEVIVESSVICLYVDDAFDGPPLRPANSYDRARMYLWLKAIDEHYFKGIGSLTFGLALRKRILESHPTEDALEQYFDNIRIDEYRQRRRSIVKNGIDAPEVHNAIHALRRMLGDLSTSLDNSDYIAAPEYSLADACLTPLIMRLEVLGLSAMWEGQPEIEDWWQRIKARASYLRLLDESFPAEYFAGMQQLTGDAWPKVKHILLQ